MRKIFKRIIKGRTEGQSLVEMAIITPLLIFFLIGVFEVGWALRNYLVLVNVNREITRFAVRPGYLNFSTQDDIDTSFLRVRNWASSSVSEQLNLDFSNTGDINNTGSTTLIISHAVIDTGKPCETENDPDCSDCSAFEDPAYNPFPQDDLILHPGLPGYEYQSAQFGPPETVTGVRDTQIDYDSLVTNLAAKNNEFNCEIMKKGGVPSSNNIIITELYHDQPQLFGFPLISNPFTDPVSLYTHTVMRLINAARSSGSVEGSLTSGIDTIGPICLVYPMLADSADTGSPDPENIIQEGWLKWGDLIADDEDYLEYALLYPQMSLNDFDTPGGVKTGSSVNKATVGTPSELADEVDTLQGRKVIIPTSANPSADPVTVDGFVWATIESYDLGTGEVMARFDTTTPLPAACTN